MGFADVPATDPSLINPPMPQGNPFLEMAMAKKQAEESAQSKQPEAYDSTGKSQETIMAETGRQSELDEMSSQPPQPIERSKTGQQSTSDELNSQGVEQTQQPVSQSVEQPLTQSEQQQLQKQEKTVQMDPVQQKSSNLPQPESQVNLDNIQVTSRANQSYLGGRINRGTDFAGPQGTPVSLPKGEWEVLDARNDIRERTPENFTASSNYGWGNSVKVRNKDTGEVMRLSHMQHGSVPDLKPGQTLEGGKIIGAIGNTGNTHGKTGNHLDVEYYDSEGNRKDIANTQYVSGLFSGKEKYQQPNPQQDLNQQTNIPVEENVQQEPSDITKQITEQLTKENDQKQNGFQAAEQMFGLEQTTPSQQHTAANYEPIIQLVPESQREVAKTAIPQITNALKEQGITDPNAVAYALATASHESGFVPKEEVMAQRGINARNDYIADLQDNYEGGKKYRGRGYIQLTHKGNYKKYGDMIDVDLVNNPEKANDPEVAAKILAAYIKENEIDKLASQGNYDQARVRVQGKGALNNQFIDTTRQIGQQASQWSQYL